MGISVDCGLHHQQCATTVFEISTIDEELGVPL